MTRWPPLPADVAPVPGRMKGKTMTDKAEIEALVRRAETALHNVTPGPWHTEGTAPWNLTVHSSASNRVCFMAHSNGLNDDRDMATGAFIASARDLVEDMSTALTALQAQLAAAEARAEKAEGALNDVDNLIRQVPSTHGGLIDQARRKIRPALPDAKGGE